MVHLKPYTRSLGLIALSLATLSSSPGKIGVVVNGFVSPIGGTTASSSRQATVPSLRMSVSLPDEGTPSNRENRNDMSAADNLDSLNPVGDADISDPSLASSSGVIPISDSTTMEVPENRQLRWEREGLVRSKYVSDDAAVELRKEASALREEIVELRQRLADNEFESEKEARATKGRLLEVERELLALKGRDAEFAYAVSLELLEKAREEGDEDSVKKHQIQMEEARLCIPQLNMHGLWVGKYGDHGYEMVNVTYDGDTLVATKVTGDRNVPKGEVSFTVDLSPIAPVLEPIELNPKASRQWGKKYLPRFMGKGRVASENFENARWMEGQLILVGRFFSFAWVPIGHQVFFGRPSAELTIRMLKEAKEEELKREGGVAVMRDAVKGMWEETYWTERESNNFANEGCFE